MANDIHYKIAMESLEKLIKDYLIHLRAELKYSFYDVNNIHVTTSEQLCRLGLLMSTEGIPAQNPPGGFQEKLGRLGQKLVDELSDGFDKQPVKVNDNYLRGLLKVRPDMALLVEKLRVASQLQEILADKSYPNERVKLERIKNVLGENERLLSDRRNKNWDAFVIIVHFLFFFIGIARAVYDSSFLLTAGAVMSKKVQAVIKNADELQQFVDEVEKIEEAEELEPGAPHPLPSAPPGSSRHPSVFFEDQRKVEEGEPSTNGETDDEDPFYVHG